jgi:hypothetical protein
MIQFYFVQNERKEKEKKENHFLWKKTQFLWVSTNPLFKTVSSDKVEYSFKKNNFEI